MSSALPEETVFPEVNEPASPATMDMTKAFTPTESEVPAPAPSTDDPLIGSSIGRYRLLKKLGEGGMGSVYLADQSEPVKRQVAVKLIRGFVDSRTVLARFEAERQALAVMDHPNIARIYDGGTTASHQPYFVMELVQGVPFTEYCDQHRLSPKQRLELFVPICWAVQHAHQKGIIHRDLKPSNVLVTEVDGKPVPKVIDFGVAKATEQPLTEQSLGDTGAIVGTPMYMSPEQAEPEMMDVDTRTDIYALGVMLYELLTGSTPIDAKQFRRGALFEVLRMVREVEPPRPSTKLSTAQALPSIAANRNVEPRELQAMLRGDVDWIVMKAIEKDRTRRYETASGFATDVMRYLSGEAVLAHPPSAVYRMKKFVRRNKGPVLAVMLVAFTLIGGIVGTTLGLLEAQRQEEVAKDETKAKDEALRAEQKAKEQALRERDEKERERSYAQAIADFVRNDFLALTSVEGQERFGGKNVGLSKDATLRKLLDRAAQKLTAREDIDPRIAAELYSMIGLSYRGSGDYAQSVTFLERSVPLYAKAFGEDDVKTLEARNCLAFSYFVAGRVEEAIKLSKQVLAARMKLLGADHIYTLATMSNLALAYRASHRTPEAISLFEKIRDAFAKSLETDHPDFLATLNNLAIVYLDANRLPEAIKLLEHVRVMREKTLGVDHPNTLSTLHELARAYQVVGRLADAISLLEHVRDAKLKILESDHPDTLTTQSILALAYHAAGRQLEAIKILEYVRDTQFKTHGMNHPDTLATLNSLAMAYHASNRLDEAIRLYKQVHDGFLIMHGSENPNTLNVMNNLAAAHLSKGEVPEAIKLLEHVRDAKVKQQGADHVDTLGTLSNLAGAYRSAKQLQAAIKLYEQVRDIRVKKLGIDHPSTILSLGNLAQTLRDDGRLTEALPLFEQAIHGIVKREFQHQHAGGIISNAVAAYAAANQFDKAEKWQQTWLAFIKKKAGTQSSAYVSEQTFLAVLYLKQKRWTDAEPMLRECLSLCEKGQPDFWTTFYTMSLLGEALLGQKKYIDAEPLLLKGYEGMKIREAKIPLSGKAKPSEALDRLIYFYTETNKSDEVKKWQVEKAKLAQQALKGK